MRPLLLAALVSTVAAAGSLGAAPLADHAFAALARCDTAKSAPTLVDSYDSAGSELKGAGIHVEKITGPALEAAIRVSRWKARRSGARAVPPEMSKYLAGYFPSGMLDDVRWASLDHELKDLSVRESCLGTSGAMTFGDTVVFSSDDAAKDLRLWAHELVHVAQYRQLGVSGFARAYARDFAALEDQARTIGNSIADDVRRSSPAALAGELPHQQPQLASSTF